jgi:hypothetical protein
MASEELLVLDGLTLNDATFGLAELHCPPPRERPEWIGAADSEAQLLARTPLHENRDITVRIQIAPQVDMDTALDKVGQLVDKCAKASKYQDGIELAWTPASSTRTVTFDVLSAEITDLPIDNENGWMLALAPTVTITMKAKPYWRGTPLENITDNFSTDTLAADWTVTSGTPAITGGVLALGNTGTTRLYYSGAPYELSDCQVTAKINVVTLGATIEQVGVVVKQVDTNNLIYVVANLGSSATVNVRKIDGGVDSSLASSAITAAANGNDYWLRGRIEGNLVTLEWWTDAPAVTGTPATTLTHTLTGGDDTQFGSGVAGRQGLIALSIDTASNYTFDDFTIEPNVFRRVG